MEGLTMTRRGLTLSSQVAGGKNRHHHAGAHSRRQWRRGTLVTTVSQAPETLQASGSRTLSRGLAVLRCLGQSPEGATVAELSTATGLDRAVLYRLLETLADEGFV